jgi:nucleoside-diphosphate kinase
MENQSRERTLVIVKPDGVQRGLIGETIKRIEQTGLKLVALKITRATEDLCWEHYQKDDTWYQEKGANTIKNLETANLPIEKEAIEYGKDIIKQLVSFMTAGPVVPMVFEGNQAVGIVKKLVGSTEPLSSDVGTLRGDFTIDSYDLATVENRAVRNLIHCTGDAGEEDREIDLWFNSAEIMDYTTINERTLHDVNLDGILE